MKKIKLGTSDVGPSNPADYIEDCWILAESNWQFYFITIHWKNIDQFVSIKM